MKLHWQKATIVVLCFALLLNITACSSTEDSNIENTPEPEKISEKVFTSKFSSLELDSDYVQSGCITSGGVYIIGDTCEEVTETGDNTSASEPDTYPMYIYGVSLFDGPLDGGKFQQLDGYRSYDLLDGEEGSLYSLGIYPGKDSTIWITTYVSRWYSDSSVILQQFDAVGNEMARIDLGTLTGDIPVEEICSTMVDFEGNLYIGTTNSIWVFDSKQNLMFTVESKVPSTPNDSLFLLTDGCVGLRSKSDYFDDTSTYVLQTINAENSGWGASYTLPGNSEQIFPGSGSYLFFCNAGDSLYGYNVETGELEQLLIWTSININSGNILCLTALDDEQLAVVTSTGGKAEIAILTKVDPAALPETTILTYATLNLRSDIRADIVEFNKSHFDYRIEVHDYSAYNTSGNSTQGLSKLNTELLAGKIDILDTNSLPILQYGSRGILEDLLSYLDNDPELDRDSVMGRVLEAAMQDGKLYQAFSSFSILSAAGNPNVVGNRLSWTLEDLITVLKTMPESYAILGSNETKETLLADLLPMILDNFVDWDVGECSFTDEEFKALLEFCNSVSPVYEEEEESYLWVTEGKQLLLPVELCRLDSDYLLYPTAFGGTCSFIGYPQQNSSAGSYFKLSDGMAITTFCQNKEAAWAFVREMFLPKHPTGTYFGSMFPINSTDFHRMVEVAMTPSYVTDEYGQQAEMVSFVTPPNSSLQIPVRAITQGEYEQFIQLYDTIDAIYSFDKNIYDIVVEEAGAYFSGDRAVEDVAELIQRRVSLYINESM